MRKLYLLSLIVCMIILVGGTTSATAKHFDYNEAFQIMNGTWIDTSTGVSITPVWKSKDGSECNIINNGYGFTDLWGNSEIYFDYKGMVYEAFVTFYPDQKKYYAKFVKINPQNGKQATIYECMVKQ